MRIVIPNLIFFCVLGFLADLFNFAGAQAEIFTANFTFGATELQLGILASFNCLFYALPTFYTGLLSERWGRRPLVLAALVGMGTSYLWGAYAGSVRELYAVTTLRALSTALLWPPVMAWMARAVPASVFPRFLGAYNLSWAVGIFIGFWGSGYLFQHMGQQSPFLWSAAAAVVLLIFVMVFTPSGGVGGLSPAGQMEEKHDYGLDAVQTLFFVRQGLLMAAVGAVAVNSGLYLFPKVGEGILTEVQIGGLNSIRLLGQMVAFFVMGRFGMWHFKSWPVWTIMGVLTLGLTILAAGSGYWQFVSGFILVGFGFGAGYAMCAFYVLGLSETKGRGSGLMEAMIGAGGLTGPLLGGAIGMISNARVGIVSGVVPVIAGAFASTRRRKPSD